MSLTVAILIGGLSKRMGRDKANLNIHGRTMIDLITDASKNLSEKRILIGNTLTRSNYSGWSLIQDSYKNAGPLGGLCTAMENSDTERLLLLACDMPFLTFDFLYFMTKIQTDMEAVIPFTDRGPEPLCGLYKTSILNTAQKALNENKLSMREFIRTIQIYRVMPNQWSMYSSDYDIFTNVNTPEDYSELIQKTTSNKK